MRAALSLARRGLGTVWPNPAVGCVLVAPDGGAGRIVGRGWTQPGGRPHAEAEALSRAGDGARHATAYVTLEPCSHRGATPPCADALVRAGVARVVVAIEDPDGRVAGRGLARLREAGVRVDLGCCAEEAADLNAGYLMRQRCGRPLVALKLATTLDGRIAVRTGESRWITGEIARRRAHLLRMSHDAVMVGIGTALADDPLLTCRLAGLEDRSPVRIVVDTRLRLPPDSRIVRSARDVPTWMIAVAGTFTEGKAAARRRLLSGHGVEVIEAPADADGHPDMRAALRMLGERGITRLLVEGGGGLAAALLRAEAVDRLYWFRTPGIVGGDGIAAVAPYGIGRLSAMRRFERIGVECLGDDVLETYRAEAGPVLG